MSTAGRDISEALVNGIYTVLSGNVTIGTITYKVYKNPEEGQTNKTRVLIGTVIDTENGTKEDYVYNGSIAIETIDEQQVATPKKALSQQVSGKVRSLLETAKGTTFAVTDLTLSVFRHGGSTQITESTNNKRLRYRIIDIYEFIIE